VSVPAATSLRPRLSERVEGLESILIFGLLCLIVLVFALWAPSGTFFTAMNLKDILLDTSETLIEAVGMTFLLIAAAIDLSIGSMVVFAAVVSAEVMGRLGGTSAQVAESVFPHLAVAVVAGISLGVVSGLLWGTVNAILAVKLRIPPFITTLASAGVILGLAEVWTGGINVETVPLQLQYSFGLGELAGVIPWMVLVAAVIAGLAWVVLARTSFGMRTYAIGASREAARRAGINVERHLMKVFMLMGALAGIVGVIDAARFGTAAVSGHTTDALNAIAAVVIGGTSLFGGRGRISGTIVGSLIPSVLTNGFIIVGVQPFWQPVAVGCVLLLAVYLDQVRRRSGAS